MQQEERLDYLINELLEESHYRDLEVRPKEKPRLLRALMNVRMPGKINSEFLEIQDAYLREESKRKGIINWQDIPTVVEQYGSRDKTADRISLWRGDITRLSVDGIVNAANSQMLGCFVPCHGCIDNAIHSAAGIQLRQECAEQMRQQGYEEPTGRAKLTEAYNLPSKFVLHTVGPIVRDRLTNRDCQLLESCYLSCLELAEANSLKSIAFCCISTGEFHFPNEIAAEIAVDTVKKYLQHSKITRVIFNVFKEEDLKCYEKLLGK